MPYENYRKVFRTSQKNIEKEMCAVQTAANELAKKDAPEADADATVKAIDGMIARVEGLKRKVRTKGSRATGLIPCTDNPVSTHRSSLRTYMQLSDMQETAGAPTLSVIRERLQHLGTLEEIESANAPEFTRWADVRLDRWLVDWSLRNGKEKTARAIAAQKGIEVRTGPESHTRQLMRDLLLTGHVLWHPETRGYRSVFGHPEN